MHAIYYLEKKYVLFRAAILIWLIKTKELFL